MWTADKHLYLLALVQSTAPKQRMLGSPSFLEVNWERDRTYLRLLAVLEQTICAFHMIRIFFACYDRLSWRDL